MSASMRSFQAWAKFVLNQASSVAYSSTMALNSGSQINAKSDSNTNTFLFWTLMYSGTIVLFVYSTPSIFEQNLKVFIGGHRTDIGHSTIHYSLKQAIAHCCVDEQWSYDDTARVVCIAPGGRALPSERDKECSQVWKSIKLYESSNGGKGVWHGCAEWYSLTLRVASLGPISFRHRY